MDVYVLTDACGFSVCLAIAVYMQFMSLQMRVGFLLVLLLSAAVISQSEGGWWGRVWSGIKRVYANNTLMFVSPLSALRVCVCVCVCVCVTDRVIYIHSLPLPSLFLSRSYTCMSMNET